MKLNNTEIELIGQDPETIKEALNKEFPTRESLIGSSITAYGDEFVMLEQNLGMQWIYFFMKLMDTDTTGLAATLGTDETSPRRNIRWTFEEESPRA